MSGGLLIVNADDYGAAPDTTDAILECYARGAVSSVTTMVWMADSERAAELALERDLPAGLHLNLTMPFDGPDVPREAAERQAALTHRLARSLPLTRWVYQPFVRRALDAEVAAQLERFRELYDREPTHVDGHNHAHLSPNVLLSPALPRGVKLRTSHDFAGGPRGSPKVIRRMLIRRRFATTDSFFSIGAIHPRLGGRGLNEALDLARTHSVELMVHPHWDDEYRLLTSEEWTAALAGLRLGSYRDLMAA